MTSPVLTGASALLSALDIWSTGPAGPPVQPKAPAVQPIAPTSAATEVRLPEAPVQLAAPASIATEAKLPEPASPPPAEAKRMSLSARLAASGAAASYRQYGPA